MSYLLVIIAVLLLRPWWRPIAAWGALVLALALLWRLAPMIGMTQAWLNTLAGSALVGFVVGMLLLFVPMYNLMIELRRRAAHDRVDKEHDGLRYRPPT